MSILINVPSFNTELCRKSRIECPQFFAWLQANLIFWNYFQTKIWKPFSSSPLFFVLKSDAITKIYFNSNVHIVKIVFITWDIVRIAYPSWIFNSLYSTPTSLWYLLTSSVYMKGYFNRIRSGWPKSYGWNGSRVENKHLFKIYEMPICSFCSSNGYFTFINNAKSNFFLLRISIRW